MNDEVDSVAGLPVVVQRAPPLPGVVVVRTGDVRHVQDLQAVDLGEGVPLLAVRAAVGDVVAGPPHRAAPADLLVDAPEVAAVRPEADEVVEVAGVEHGAGEGERAAPHRERSRRLQQHRVVWQDGTKEGRKEGMWRLVNDTRYQLNQCLDA